MLEGEDAEMENQEHAEQENLPLDRSEARCVQHRSVGKRVKALYVNGWHEGIVQYYNSEMAALKIDYPDGSSDSAKKPTVASPKSPS